VAGTPEVGFWWGEIEKCLVVWC